MMNLSFIQYLKDLDFKTIIILAVFITPYYITSLKKYLRIKGSKNKNPHADCKNNDLRIRENTDLIDALTERHELKRELLTEQMTAFLDFCNRVKKIKLSHYLKKQRDIHGSESRLFELQDVDNYKKVLKNIYCELEVNFRNLMRKNHLLEKSDIEYSYFSRSERDNLRAVINDRINEEYYVNANPDIIGLFEHNRNIEMLINKEYNDLFDEVRLSARRIQKRRDNVEKRINKYKEYGDE